MYRESPLVCLRAACVLAVTIGGLTAGWFYLPWPGTVSVPGIIEFKDSTVVRSRTAGFINHICVQDGSYVNEGELLLVLRNEQLEMELRSLELEIKQEAVRYRIAQDKQQVAEQQIALRNQKAAKDRLAEMQRRSDALKVYAPAAGRVVARNLENRSMTYVKEGDELLTIGDETRKEFVISLPQQPLEEVSAWLGKRVNFRIGSHRMAAGVLERIDPRATLELPHPALSAEVGGPLAVSRAKVDDGSLQTRLVEPRFRAVIALSSKECRDVYSGEQGHAVLGWSQHRFGEHLWWVCTRWFKDRLKSLQS
jgi:biotin carboxyl carrier protein